MIPIFQSTHPHGVRHRKPYGLTVFTKISIHAPAWGATLVHWTTNPVTAISIHAPAWGATRPGHLQRIPRPISIHAPAWGATIKRPYRAKNRRKNFNPRTRMGCDSVRMTTAVCATISIHAPAWGATIFSI